MTIYELLGHDSYAGYLPISIGVKRTEIESLEFPAVPLEKWIPPVIREYLGDPPEKPRKKGHFHQSSAQLYISDFGRRALSEYLEQVAEFRPVVVEGREAEPFFRFWVTRVVDCLDVKASILSGTIKSDSIGVVKVPAFDMTRWDGSDIFRIPRDLNHVVYCSERFVAACKKARISGMKFGIGLFDPKPMKIG